MIRLRYPFAGAFAALALISAYIGLGPNSIPAVNDKALHFVTFFLLTVSYKLFKFWQAAKTHKLTLYWAIDVPRRFLLKIVLGVMLALSVGSELLQELIPNNNRVFDPVDIAFNVAGTVAALALCNWYNKRMLERRRRKKYGIVPAGDDAGDVELNAAEFDVEEQELGITGDDDDDGEAWDAMDSSPVAASGTAENGLADAGKT